MPIELTEIVRTLQTNVTVTIPNTQRRTAKTLRIEIAQLPGGRFQPRVLEARDVDTGLGRVTFYDHWFDFWNTRGAFGVWERANVPLADTAEAALALTVAQLEMWEKEQ